MGDNRVLAISYLFPPTIAMGAQACAQIARHLPSSEWTPVVLTVRGEGPAGTRSQAESFFQCPVVRTAVIPHPLPVYRRLRSRFGRATREVVDANAGYHEARRHSGVWYWILSLMSVPDVHTGWILPAVVTGLRVIRRYRITHLFSSGPPWTSQLVALMLARITGLPWTAHFRDPWTAPRVEMARMKPVTAMSLRVEEALERLTVRRADAVVCVTEEHAALLRQAHPKLRASKFVTIPNGFDGAEWDGPADDDGSSVRGPGKDPFVITYAGALYNRRSPVPIFRALSALMAAGEIAQGNIRVDLLGWCDVAEGRRVRDLAVESGLDGCVRQTGPLGRAETLQRMLRSDLLLLLAEGLTLQVPGKTYEYLRAGRPILALAPEGAVSRLLRRTGGAWVVDPADQHGIVNAIREAYRSWSEGRSLPTPDPAVVAGFDRCILAGRFAEVFAAVSSSAQQREVRPHGLTGAQAREPVTPPRTGQ